MESYALSKQDSQVYDPSKQLGKHRMAAVGQRVTDFLALLRIAHLEALIFCEDEPRASSLWKDTAIISSEATDPHRQAWTNKSLGALVEVAGSLVMDFCSTQDNPLNILTYASSVEWEQLARLYEGKLRVVGPSAYIKDLIDNKISTRFALREWGLPVPSSIEVANSSLDFPSLSRTLGVPFVLQMPVGSSGIGTHLVHDRHALQKIQNSGYEGDWLASRYAGETTLNVHGLALPNQVFVSSPSVQITGIDEIATDWGTYCGNDFSSANNLSASMKDVVHNLVKGVGQWLLDIGYEGIYGVDVAINEQDASIVEVNPRLQGSTWLLSEIETEMGLLPLVIQHFLWHLGEQSQHFYSNGNSDKTIDGAYLLIHSTVENPVFCQHKLRPGAYDMDQHGILHWKHESVGLHELDGSEILLFGLPPSGGSVIESGSVIARVASRLQLSSNNGRELTPIGKHVVMSVKRELNFC